MEQTGGEGNAEVQGWAAFEREKGKRLVAKAADCVK